MKENSKEKVTKKMFTLYPNTCSDKHDEKDSGKIFIVLFIVYRVTYVYTYLY